jgi:hypothetical protein
MAKHFKITLKVAYESGTVPSNIKEQLYDRFKYGDLSDFLDFSDEESGESIVEDWSVEVENAGVMPSVPSEPMKV